MRVMVVGGNFRGKGAEAMLFTVQHAIKEAVPNSVCCVVASSENERIRLQEAGFLPIKKQIISRLKRIYMIVSSPLLRFSQKRITQSDINNNEIVNIFRISDIVVDISGFASGDQFGWRPAASRLIQIYTAKLSGNKIYFMPQSWGPFNDFRTRVLTRMMLWNSEFICAREKQSYDYLIDTQCARPEKVLLSPDIAFQFQAAKPEIARHIMMKAGLPLDQPIIAITPNMRIYERTTGHDSNNMYVKGLLSIMKYFLSDTTCQILLLPHEATVDKANDFELCEMIMNNINGMGRIFMLDGKETASETKAIIGMCDFLVASRYHSLIAALSMRVPTVVIGWSHKYDEVMKELGLERWVIDPVNRPGSTTREIVIDAWNNKRETLRVLDEQVHRLECQSGFALQRMVDTIIHQYGSK